MSRARLGIVDALFAAAWVAWIVCTAVSLTACVSPPPADDCRVVAAQGAVVAIVCDEVRR